MLTVLYVLMILTPFMLVVGLASVYMARRERERQNRWYSAVKAPENRRSRGGLDLD